MKHTIFVFVTLVFFLLAVCSNAGTGSGANCPRGQGFCEDYQCCPCEYFGMIWSDDLGYCICPPCHVTGFDWGIEKNCAWCYEIGKKCSNGRCVDR